MKAYFTVSLTPSDLSAASGSIHAQAPTVRAALTRASHALASLLHHADYDRPITLTLTISAHPRQRTWHSPPSP